MLYLTNNALFGYFQLHQVRISSVRGVGCRSNSCFGLYIFSHVLKMFTSLESSALNGKFGGVWIDWFVSKWLLLGAAIVTFYELAWSIACPDKDMLWLGSRVVLFWAFETLVVGVNIEAFASVPFIREVLIPESASSFCVLPLGALIEVVGYLFKFGAY